MKDYQALFMVGVVAIALIILHSCGSKKEEPRQEQIVPKSALFLIQDLPKPVAYKTDTAQPWVILDSAATLKVLLKSVEDNYNRAVEMSRRQQEIRKDSIK